MIQSWKKQPNHTVSTEEHITVTIVVALRNEEKNVKRLLESLYAQTYQNIHFIFIDDHSDDSTFALLKENIHSKSTLLQLKNNEKGKKSALRKGIEFSNSELIITTDADCIHSSKWVETIVSYYILNDKPLMLSAPVKFAPSVGFLQKLETIEFGSLILTGACSLFLKQPNMCNGANLSFQRDAFLSQNDYSLHAHLPTGDDEFFLHQIAAHDPTKIVFIKDVNALVSTPPPSSLSTFIHQRIRWASKWKHYKNKGPQWNAIFIFLVHFTFLLSLFNTLLFDGNLYIFSTALYLRILGEFFFNRVILQWQNDKNLIKWIPIVSLFYPFYAFSIGILATFTKYSWKKRKYNV